MAFNDASAGAYQANNWDPYSVRRNKVNTDVPNNILASYYPGAESAAKFGSAVEGQRQSYLQQMINQNSPQNQANLIGQFGRQQAGIGADNGRLASEMLRGRGGIGAEQGAALQQVNNANKNTNDFAAHLQSPEGQAQLAQLYQALFSQAQSNPALEKMLPLLQSLQQNQQFHQSISQNQGGGILDGLMGIAGDLAGGGGLGAGGALTGLLGGRHGGGGGGGTDWGTYLKNLGWA